MKFTVEASEWCKRIGFIVHALPGQGRAEKVWSTGILVEASGDDVNGVVKLMATDIKQVGMTDKIKAKVLSVGRCLIPGQLQGLFFLLAKDGEITIEYDENNKNITIKTDYYEGHFPCLDEIDFRVMGLSTEAPDAKKVSLPMTSLQKIVELIAPSADAKDIEQGKSGVLFRCEQKLDVPIEGATVMEMMGGRRVPVDYAEIPASPSRLVVVALDGKKMSKYEELGLFDDIDANYFSASEGAQRPFEKIPHFEVMIPAGLLQTASRALGQLSQTNASVDVSVFGGFITLTCGDSAVALRLLDASLPNWRRVIARPAEYSMIVSTEELKLAAQIASVSNLVQKDSPIIIYMKNGDIRIGNGVLNDDKSAREIRSVVQTEGELPENGLYVGFNYERFSHVLNYIKTDYVCLNFAKGKCMLLYNCIAEQGEKEDKPTYTIDELFLGMVMPVSI